MIVFAIYFITTDGRLMLREIFQTTEKLPSEFILSGLLTSFKAIANEITDSYPETLVMGNVSYHFENFDDYYMVIVTDSREKPEELSFTLGMKFAGNYGDRIQGWNGSLDEFRPFQKVLIKEIARISNMDETKTLNPDKRLDASELLFLPHHLQDIALALLTAEEITMTDLWKEMNHDDEDRSSMSSYIDSPEAANEKESYKYSFYDLQKMIVELQELGYVGQKILNEEIIFFI